MPAVTPLHPGTARFEGGLTEVGPGVHAWLQPNGLLGESNAGLVVGDGASLLVDTLWDPRLTRRMLAAMAPLTDEGADRGPRQHALRRRPLVGKPGGPRGARSSPPRSARAVMEAESPAEMKRFGALAARPASRGIAAGSRIRAAATSPRSPPT